MFLAAVVPILDPIVCISVHIRKYVKYERLYSLKRIANFLSVLVVTSCTGNFFLKKVTQLFKTQDFPSHYYETCDKELWENWNFAFQWYTVPLEPNRGGSIFLANTLNFYIPKFEDTRSVKEKKLGYLVWVFNSSNV